MCTTGKGCEQVMMRRMRKDGHILLTVSSFFPSALDNLDDIVGRNSKDSTPIIFDGKFIL